MFRVRPSNIIIALWCSVLIIWTGCVVSAFHNVMGSRRWRVSGLVGAARYREERAPFVIYTSSNGGIEYNDFGSFEDDEYDDDSTNDEDDAAYLSEFDTSSSSSLSNKNTDSTDWTAALSSLRQRLDSVADGSSSSPARALFRLMTLESPNEAIGRFVTSANPEVLSSMSGAVSGLLGGLVADPGLQSTVKANGQRVASLCFQLQMTGYMFRNAEYVVALKELMRIGHLRDDLRDAFRRLDADRSGYIEVDEVERMLNDVYEDKPAPAFEVRTFLNFFDANKDGKISWEEFEKGLGHMTQDTAVSNLRALAPSDDDIDDDEDIDIDPLPEPTLSGTVQIELEDGSTFTVEAKDYIQGLKDEAQTLKDALQREIMDDVVQDAVSPNKIHDPISPSPPAPPAPQPSSSTGGIAALIQSLGGDLQQLTQGISPEVVDAMKMLVDFVLEGGPSEKNLGNQTKENIMERDMELPGSALQQLALWQLVLGYRLREAEATGEYKKMLE